MNKQNKNKKEKQQKQNTYTQKSNPIEPEENTPNHIHTTSKKKID